LGVTEPVAREVLEQDFCFRSCAPAKAVSSGIEAGKQRVEGWSHVESGW